MEVTLSKIGTLAVMGKETALVQEQSDDSKGDRLNVYWADTFDILDDLLYDGYDILSELDTSLRIINDPKLPEKLASAQEAIRRHKERQTGQGKE
jgi:hypothetical protein